jgi:hypothetical protein
MGRTVISPLIDVPTARRPKATVPCWPLAQPAPARSAHGAYHWALVPTAPNPGEPFKISITRADGQAQSLAESVSKRLGSDGALSTRQAAATVRLALNKIPALWSVGHVTVGDLWKVTRTCPDCETSSC